MSDMTLTDIVLKNAISKIVILIEGIIIVILGVDAIVIFAVLFLMYYLTRKKLANKPNPAKKQKILKRVFVLITVLFIIWSIFAPFIILKKPIYLFYEDSRLGRDKKIHLKSYDDKNYAGLLVMPGNKRLFYPILKFFLKNNLLLVEKRNSLGEDYFVLPLISKYEHFERGIVKGLSTQHLALYANNLYGVTIDLKLEEGRPTTNYIYPQLRNVKLFSEIFPTFKGNSIPWEAVIIKKSDTNLYKYIALLDLALSSASKGEIENSFHFLDKSSELAPSTIEMARVLCLIGTLASYRFYGNFGLSQALAIYDKAYEVMFSESDLLGKESIKQYKLYYWVASTLYSPFMTYNKVFNDNRMEKLHQLLAKTRKSYSEQAADQSGQILEDILTELEGKRTLSKSKYSKKSELFEELIETVFDPKKGNESYFEKKEREISQKPFSEFSSEVNSMLKQKKFHDVQFFLDSRLWGQFRKVFKLINIILRPHPDEKKLNLIKFLDVKEIDFLNNTYLSNSELRRSWLFSFLIWGRKFFNLVELKKEGVVQSGALKNEIIRELIRILPNNFPNTKKLLKVLRLADDIEEFIQLSQKLLEESNKELNQNFFFQFGVQFDVGNFLEANFSAKGTIKYLETYPTDLKIPKWWTSKFMLWFSLNALQDLGQIASGITPIEFRKLILNSNFLKYHSQGENKFFPGIILYNYLADRDDELSGNGLVIELKNIIERTFNCTYKDFMVDLYVEMIRRDKDGVKVLTPDDLGQAKK